MDSALFNEAAVIMIESHNSKSILILSSVDYRNRTSAAFSRLLNYARALLLDSEITIYLSSLRHPYSVTVESIFKIEPGVLALGDPDWNPGICRRLYLKINSFGMTAYWLRHVTAFVKHMTIPTVLVFPNYHSLKVDELILAALKTSGAKIFLEKNELEKGLVSNLHEGEKTGGWINRRCHRIHLNQAIKNDHLVTQYDGVIAISRKLEAWLQEMDCRNRIRIPVLYDVEDVPSPAVYTGSEFRIGFTGAPHEVKEGILSLVKVISRLKSTVPPQLNIYGGGSPKQIEILRDLSEKLGLKDRVQYHGVISLSEIPAALARQHLLIMPRPSTLQTEYGFATKLASYMASGVPVLTTSVSDNKYYIEDGINGFLVPPNDLEQLYQRLSEIIELSGEKLLQIGERGRRTADDHFHYRHYGKPLADFLFSS